MSKYRVELTEEQMRVIEMCCEIYMRTLLGQPFMICEELANLNRNRKLTKDDPEWESDWNDYLVRKDHLEAVIKAAFSIAYGPWSYLREKTEDMMTAETIWDAVRFARGHGGHWGEPMQVGKEPIPKIERVKG